MVVNIIFMYNEYCKLDYRIWIYIEYFIAKRQETNVTFNKAGQVLIFMKIA